MFIRYQCTTCRRTVDQLLDDKHVQPNLCVITKGCLGRLLPIAKVKKPETPTPVAGLTDWYPRGQVRGNFSTQPAVNELLLSNSDTGTLTIALRAQTPGELAATSPAVSVTFEQRVQSTIPFQQYEYRTSAGTTIITGRDYYGKILRFDQQAIDEERVLVRVNGVERTDLVLAPNLVTFNNPLNANDVVVVLVYTQQQVVRRVVPFTQHAERSAIANPGAWSNIRYVRRYDPVRQFADAWYVFSTTLPLMAHIPADGSLRLVSVNTQETGTEVIPQSEPDALMFLLSNYPWKNIDRYYNFTISGAVAAADFNLRCSSQQGVRQLSVVDPNIREEFPPLRLDLAASGVVGLSYIAVDQLDTTVTSQVLSDDVSRRQHAHTVLGPV